MEMVKEAVKTYNPREAVKAQEEYCSKINAPFFAPNGNNMYRCYYCNQNIYKDGGISVEEAGSKVITGCPFCHYSYVD